MIFAFILTLIAILVGDAVTLWLDVPIPGPVVGLVVAFLIFVRFDGPTPAASTLFDMMIPHAPVFFVPAGVGVVAHADLISASWVPIIFAILVGTAIALVATGIAMQFILNSSSRNSWFILIK